MRKKLWVDVLFQLKLVSFSMALVFLTVMILYVASDRAILEAARQTKQVYISVTWARNNLKIPFIWGGLFAVLAGGLITFYKSHALAGPLRALRTGMKEVENGNLRHEMTLRETDELQELAANFQKMKEALKEKIEKDRARLFQIQREIDEIRARTEDPSLRQALSSLESELRSLTSGFQV